MRSLPFRFGCFSLLMAAVSLVACGGSHDDLAKRLASMQGDLTRLQNHSDRLEERLEALELRKEQPLAPRMATEVGPTLDHPRLMVVKLEPGGGDGHDAAADAPAAQLRPEDSAADDTPRPVIRVHGSHTDGDVTMANDSDGSNSPRHKR